MRVLDVMGVKLRDANWLSGEIEKHPASKWRNTPSVTNNNAHLQAYGWPPQFVLESYRWMLIVTLYVCFIYTPAGLFGVVLVFIHLYATV